MVRFCSNIFFWRGLLLGRYAPQHVPAKQYHGLICAHWLGFSAELAPLASNQQPWKHNKIMSILNFAGLWDALKICGEKCVLSTFTKKAPPLQVHIATFDVHTKL